MTQTFKVGEMLNKRSPNSKTWMNFDGSYTTEISHNVVHFKDNSGNFHNISTDLYDEADLFDYHGPVEENGAAILNTAKERAISDVEAGKLNRDNYDFQGLCVPFLAKIPRIFKRGYTIGEGNNSLKFIPIGSSPTKGYVDDTNTNAIHYQDAWNDTDVTLELKDNGIKETIILKTDKAPTLFSFEVQGGLEDDLSSGNMRLEPAWLEDKKGEKRDVSQTIRRVDDKTFVDLVADTTGLTFPVYVDPTITIDDKTYNKDSYIIEGSSNNYGSYTNFYLRYHTNGSKENPVLAFDLSTIPVNSKGLSCELILTGFGTSFNHPTWMNNITATFYNEIWSESLISWTNQPTKGVTVGPLPFTNNYNTGSVTQHTFSGLEKYVELFAGQRYNPGFMLQINGAVPSDNQNMSFYSKEYTGGTYRPKLRVSYNMPPSKPTLTKPNGGENWNSLHTVEWTPSDDTHESVLNPITSPEFSASGANRYAQVFTVESNDWVIKKVGVYLGSGGANELYITMLLKGVAEDGSPNSTTYASEGMWITNKFGLVELDVNNLSVPAGTKLAIEVATPNITDLFKVYLDQNNSYKNGYYVKDDVISPGNDLGFAVTYDEGTPQIQLKYQIQLTANNGTTWKDIVPLTPAGATSYNYDFINETESSLCKVRIRAFDGSSYGDWDESNGVFTIMHNQAPVTPTNLQPNGTIIDRAVPLRLSWKHNDPNTSDPQSKFDIRWRTSGNPVWNTITQSTINQYYDVPANTFPLGHVEWNVRTYDQAGLSSPFSSSVIFTTANKSEKPTVIYPTSNASVPIANPVVQWSHPEQVAYWVRVLAEDGVTVLFEDNRTSTNKAVTIPYSLSNNAKYTVQVAVKDAGGLWSNFVDVPITVSYTPPALPTLTTVENNTIGAITVHVYNPPPIGTEPTVIYNDLFRKEGNGDWVRVGTNIANDSDFIDYTPKTETVISYYAIAYGNNGTIRKSNTIMTKVKIAHTQLSLASNPSFFVQMQKRQGSQEFNSIENEKMQFAGRSYPMTEFGEKLERNFDYSYKMFSQQEMEMAKELVSYGETLLLRDNRGRKDYVTISDITIDERPILWEISISPQKVYYVEGV